MLKYIAICMLAVIAGCASTHAENVVETSSPGAKPNEIQVMVLGTYHMAGSTSDLINVEADSVLTQRRQQELAELADALAAFKPTVVITERVTEAPDYIDPKYAEFTDATLLESENERVQVAYRLAERAGVTRVHGVDEQPSEGEPDYFPFDKVMEHASATGQQDAIGAFLASMQKIVEDFTAETAEDHIALKLLKINTGPMSAPDFYYALSEFDQGEEQPGAELQAYWFMRNAKIWSKLMDVTQPGDRVVVVYGAGHKYWLEHMADHTDGYMLVDPAPFLEAAFQ